MTILRSVKGSYWTVGHDLADLLEVDRMVKFYQRKYPQMSVIPLGGPDKVAPNERLIVVAHGNADGLVDGLQPNELQQRLAAHGVAPTMALELAACFSVQAGEFLKKTQIGDVDSFSGVLNIVGKTRQDIVLALERTKQEFALRNNDLGQATQDCILKYVELVNEIKGKVQQYGPNKPLTGTSIRWSDLAFFVDVHAQLEKIPGIGNPRLNFGGAVAEKSKMTVLVQWLQNVTQMKRRDTMPFWSRFVEQMIRPTSGRISNVTVSEYIMGVSKRFDDIHTRYYVQAETIQKSYQKNLRRYNEFV